jgi:hypothetical protein
LIEFTVLIPVVSNAGQAFSPEHDSVFEAFLLDRFGGFSRMPGLVAGAWIGEGGFTYRDATRAYVVAAASILDAVKLRDVIDFAKLHYAQEAVFLRYLGLAEVL